MADAPAATRAVVLHPDIQSDRGRRAPEAALSEAMALARALPGLDVLRGEVVPLPEARPRALFGRGKIEALGESFATDEIGLVLVDGPVTPVQQRNLERDWKLKVLDRTGLILEIFSDRARTREGVMQVEMAALAYQRTRLVRAWTHLERQRGGLGFVGGPGETQIEADRRAIDAQIGRLKRQLGRVIKTRALHRAARARVPYPIVALVGYTNAGKSTLFNRLTGAGVMAEDMLFATLDPTMRAVDLAQGPRVILSDTVGFISDLPTELVAAFRATLEEVRAADLILHVRDVAHPETDAQAAEVAAILADLDAAETPALEVWNKADLAEPALRERLEALALRHEAAHLVSAATGEGIGDLLATVTAALDAPRRRETVMLEPSEGRRRAWLFEEGVVEDEVQDGEETRLTVNWTQRQAESFRRLR